MPGQNSRASNGRSDLTELYGLEIASRAFACPFIGYDFEGNLLALLQCTKACAFDSGDVDKYVLLSVVGLHETIALLLVKPLHSTRIHGIVLQLGYRKVFRSVAATPKDPLSIDGGVLRALPNRAAKRPIVRPKCRSRKYGARSFTMQVKSVLVLSAAVAFSIQNGD
jgi:hypothetical protein